MADAGRPLTSEGFYREAAELPWLDDGPVDLPGWFDFDGPTSGGQTQGRASGQPRRPIELEIGSGKGTFLVQQAAQHPEVDYLGIEYARGYARHAADRARRLGLNNVRLLHGEASSFVRHYVPAEALGQVHIYFPDPWPKKRHHKRRLIQPPFLDWLWRALEPPRAEAALSPQAGYVHLCTDHADYFAWMEEAVAERSHLYARHPFMPPTSAAQGELAGTNFERKYRREGRAFHGMTLSKLP